MYFRNIDKRDRVEAKLQKSNKEVELQNIDFVKKKLYKIAMGALSKINIITAD
jgi:hypothetical protein